MCASSHHLARSPALSVLDVTASQGTCACACTCKLRSRRAAEIDELSCCTPSMRQAGSAEEPMRLLSPHACRCTYWEAGKGSGGGAGSATRACLVDRAAQSTIAVHDHVPYRCLVLCVSVALERGWHGRNVHGDGIPVRPSCLYININYM